MQIDSISLDHLAGMLVMGDDPTEFLWASAPFFGAVAGGLSVGDSDGQQPGVTKKTRKMVE